MRFNFRGIGASAGAWDDGPGEIDDALAVVAARMRDPGQPLALAGFSFGGYVASQAAARLQPTATRVERLVLVGPATANFAVAAGAAGHAGHPRRGRRRRAAGGHAGLGRPQALPVVVVPGVGHFFHGQLPLLKSLVVRHLRRCGPPPALARL